MDDRDPLDLPMEDEYRRAQAPTRRYVDMVDGDLERLVREHLRADLAGTLEGAEANRALEKALLRALRDDDPMSTAWRRMIRDEARKSAAPVRLASALGGGLAGAVLTLLALWIVGVFPASGPAPTNAAPTAAVPAPSAPEQTAAEPDAAGYIALFDQRFVADTLWSGAIGTRLIAEATPGVGAEVARWIAGTPFDTAKVRRAAALLILKDRQLDGFRGMVDGEYSANCAPNNCVTVLRAWEAAAADPGPVAPPPLPEGEAWKADPAPAMAPFEKFLVARWLETRGTGG